MKFKPGKGWKQANGPVWDHASGIRLHIFGLLRFPDGKTVSANWWPECQEASRWVRVAGGNRKRGMMLWALNKLEVK